MSTDTLHPVSSIRHQNKSWLKPVSYNWAVKDQVCILNASEVITACMSMAVGFMKYDDGYLPHGILGIGAERNLMLRSDGTWTGGYLPNCYKSYPLQLGKNDDDNWVLCVEESSGLVNDGTAGNRFFAEDGTATPELVQEFEFLQAFEQQKIRTQALCALFAKHDLIQPWKINIKYGEEYREVEGIYRIDEDKLNALSPEAVIELHNSSALLLAYAQLLSMQNLSKLGKTMAQGKVQDNNSVKQQATAPVQDFDNGTGSISFDKLFTSK